MTGNSNWVAGYLQALAERRPFRDARALAPLWLAAEGGAAEDRAAGQARLTIQMAAEMYQRLVVTGPPGAGKTTALRQLACGMAESALAAAPTAAPPIPVYLELARFSGDITAALAADFGRGAPSLADIAQGRQLVFLLDGLDELSPAAQLTSLSALARTFEALGTQARWVATCRSESLPLFRPWLAGGEVRQLRPLRTRDALALLAQHGAESLAAWLDRAPDLAELATRPRWLAALQSAASGLSAPYSAGRVLAAWLPAAVDAALAAHPGTGSPVVLEQLPSIVAALGQRQGDTLPVAEAASLLPVQGGLTLLLDAGILNVTSDRQQVGFRHPALRAFGHALLLARSSPSAWSAAAGRGATDAVAMAYGLCASREEALRALLASGSALLAARCLLEEEAPERFESLLRASGSLTPALRVQLADAFVAAGAAGPAKDQLERAGAEGYDEAALFGRLGELYALGGEWRRARAAYEQALAREPADVRYRQQLGVVCSRLGELDRASAALESVLDAQQRSAAAAAHELGRVYLQQGQADRALAAFRQASAVIPTETTFRRSAAAALRRLGRADEAEAELMALLERDKGDGATYAELAQLYADTGRTQKAATFLAKAVTLQPADAALYAQLGRLRHALGDAPGARAALQRAAELTPGDSALHFELGRLAEAAGEHERALACYREAARLDAANPAYPRALAALLQICGDDEGAADALRDALEIQPDNPETHVELADLLRRAGRVEQALDVYARALALRPEHVELERTLALAYREHGRTHDALRHLQRAAGRAPDRADLQFDVAATAESLDQWDLALTGYERAAALAPERPDYARAAAALHASTGNTLRARRLLARALRGGRRDPETLYQAGALHAAEGRWPLAVTMLRRATRHGAAARYGAALANALIQVGQPGEACAAVSKSLYDRPEDPELLRLYSQALAASGDVEAGYLAARQAADGAPGDAALHQQAGVLALRLGRWNEALAMLDRAVALDSTLLAAHLARARALLALDRAEMALTAARTALDLSHDHPDAALTAGVALARLGRDEEARPLLECALGKEATAAPALAALRDVCARLGDTRVALECARRIAELAPEEPEHHVRLGELLLAAGSSGDAARELERGLALAGGLRPAADESKGAAPIAHRLRPAASAAHAGLAELFAQARAWPRARWHAEHAVALAPERADRRALLAEVLHGVGDTRGAAGAYAAAIERAPDRADWLSSLGGLLQAEGDHHGALPHLRRAAVLAPTAERHYAVAASLRALGEHGPAAEELERALRRSPGEHRWRVELAEAQFARGWYGEAVAELSRAIEALPDDARLWRMRAEARLRLGEMDQARVDLVQALKRDPRDALGYALLAQVLHEHGFDARALEAARRAVEIEPASSPNRRTLARALRATGKRAEAADQLEQALASGGPAEWWAELANDREALGELVRALDAWRRAAETDPADAGARFNLGRLLGQVGDQRGAVERLREAIAMRPGYGPAYARLAEALIAQIGISLLSAGLDAVIKAVMPKSSAAAAPSTPAVDEAVAHAQRAVALQPQSADGWRALGLALRAQGASDEALAALRKAHALEPAGAQTAFALGLALLERGDLSDAAAAFAAAADAAPDTPEYLGYLGLALLRGVPTVASDLDAVAGAGEPPAALTRAREHIARAAELAPEDRRWWCALGVADQAAGRHEQAIAAFGRALADDDAHVQAEVRRLRARSRYLTGRLAEARADLEQAAAVDGTSVDDAYLLGRVAFDQGDLGGAKRMLEELAARAPDHAQTQLYLGRTLLALGQRAEAAAVLERAAELRPDHAPTAAALSDAYAAAGRHERALTAAARAVRLDPRTAEHHQRLATLYAAGGRMHEARAALINAMTLRPDVAAWHAQMGEICLQLGMAPAAMSSFGRAVELAPAEPAYQYALSRTLARQGKAAEARDALAKAVAAAPEQGEWRFELARLHRALGETGPALEQLAAAAQYAPTAPEHWRTLAEAQMAAGDREDARETLERAMLRFGEDAGLHATLGEILEGDGEADTAAWHYAAAAEHGPAVAEHWWRLGRARLEAGDVAAARPALERALAIDPDAAHAHAALARIFAAEEDHRAALAHTQRAAEVAPNEPGFQLQLADAYAQLRRFDDARRALEHAVRLVPEDAELLARYGEMALNVGMNREALQAFERAIERRPEEPRFHFLAGRAHRRLKHYSRAIERFRRAVKLRPGYSEAIVELSTLGPLAFVAHHLRGDDDEQAA